MLAAISEPTSNNVWLLNVRVSPRCRYAANMLIFPYGEWLGGLRPHDVPRVLDVIMEQSSPMDLARTSLLPTHWRCRMGLTRDQQLKRYLLHRNNPTT